MSIDLDWLKLDASLANRVVDLLNRQLDAAERPSFIGPVQVTSLDFGSNAPDVELVDMRDIYRDFLEDDEDEDHGPVKVTEGGVNGTGIDDEEGFEWVSRRAGVMQDSGVEGLHHLPSHVRHNGFGAASDCFSPSTLPSMDLWTSGLSRPPSFAAYGMHSPYAGVDIPVYRSPSPATPFVTTPSPSRDHLSRQCADTEVDNSMNIPFSPSSVPYSASQTTPPPENPHPNLQLHFHVNWHSNLRISLQTSLLINYPSPMFMSLPIRLSITGLVFNGELVVAYEGERKRIHLCILDDLDPYGPAGGRRMSGPGTGSSSSLNSSCGVGVGASGTTKDGSNTTPLEFDDSIIMGAAGLGLGGLNALGVGNATLSASNDTVQVTSPDSRPAVASNKSLGYNPVTHAKPTKPVLPVGQRLLPSIFIESEIGQADKHVLKNVTRVEKFIQDVVRRTVEDELLFPNYHTLVMG